MAAKLSRGEVILTTDQPDLGLLELALNGTGT